MNPHRLVRQPDPATFGDAGQAYLIHGRYRAEPAELPGAHFWDVLKARPGGLEPPTCGFGTPDGSPAGPDHLITRVPLVEGPDSRVPGASSWSQLGPSGAGVLLGQLTRWSLHLPWIDGHMESRTPILDLARDCPLRKRPQVGFPRVHPVRLGPLPTRAPLIKKETAALSC